MWQQVQTPLAAAPLFNPESYRASRDAAVAKLRTFATAQFPTGTTFFLSIYGAPAALRAGAVNVDTGKYIESKPYQAWSPSTWETNVEAPLKAIGVSSWVFSPKTSWSATTKAIADKITQVDKQILGVAANQAKARTWLAAYDAETDRGAAQLAVAPSGGGAAAVPPPGAAPAFKFAAGTMPWIIGGLVVLGGLVIWKRRQ